jgi:glutamyl-tRNA reductase
MHLVAIGVNHRSAPVKLREKLAIGEQELHDVLSLLSGSDRVNEVCIVSTCNRTEMYAVTPMRADDVVLSEFLCERGGISAEKLDEASCRWVGHHAVKHLFEVASGLDSMALGETQVLGQIKSAYASAKDAGACGVVLSKLFCQAIEVGKRARTETDISCGAFSIGAAAAQMARLVLNNVSGRTALLLGAGKMSKLAAVHLQAAGIDRIYIANRTRAKAEPLATALGAELVEFGKFGDVLAGADVVISSTASPRPIITREMLDGIMAGRCHAPLFIIDIAVPRDVEPEAALVPGVFLYNIDDLEFLLDRCRGDREAEVEKVRSIIDSETTEFMGFLRTLEAVPLIKMLREKFDAVYESELRRCMKKLSHLDESDRECVARSIRSAVNKLTHDPILRLKDYAANGGAKKLDVAREIFGLEAGSSRGEQMLKQVQHDDGASSA